MTVAVPDAVPDVVRRDVRRDVRRARPDPIFMYDKKINARGVLHINQADYVSFFDISCDIFLLHA